jgi:hypothetical protein
MCLNLQTQQCCQPRLNKHNMRLNSLVSAHSNPLRSGNAPATPFRPSVANHPQSGSPPHRLVTTHSGLFDQAWGTSIDVEVRFDFIYFQVIVIVSLILPSTSKKLKYHKNNSPPSFPVFNIPSNSTNADIKSDVTTKSLRHQSLPIHRVLIPSH